jgi:hypothetical protein
MADTNMGVPFVQVPQVPVPFATTPVASQNSELFTTTSVLNAESQDVGIKAINFISPGDTVFIGEEHLDIHTALFNTTTMAWWHDLNISSVQSQPDAFVTVSDTRDFSVDPELFVGKTGDWYQWISDTKGPLVVRVEEPSIGLRIWDSTSGEFITNGEIPFGHFGNFIIESNLDPILKRNGTQPADSQIKINVTSPSGEMYVSLVGANYAEKALTHLQVYDPIWYWAGLGTDHTKPAVNDGWNTSAINPFTNTRIYPPGIYVTRAECNANHMKDNYRASDGSEYVNKTVSIPLSIRLPGADVTINATGVQPFHPGESIVLSGLNTVSDMVYLFISGQDLPISGGSLIRPFNPVLSDQPDSFTTSPVSDTDMWSYNWSIPQNITKNGTYLLYAAAGPQNLTTLHKTSYGSVPVEITNSPFEDTLDLLSGWNFIETPSVLQSGHNTMEIFAHVNSSGHSIMSYNGTSGSWMTMKAHDIFIPLNGYWVYSDSQERIPLLYDTQAEIRPMILTKGWNTLGITTPERPVKQALSSIQTIWSYLVEYDPVLQKYRDPLINQNLSDNTTLKPKDGFWIYMKENGTYTGR